MKKVFFSVLACLSTTLLTSCGGMGTAGTATTPTSGVTSATTATAIDALGSLLSNVIGSATTTQQSLVGTWSYSKPCVQFESANLLAQAGGAMAASTVEQKLASYYAKAGIKAGAFNIIFGNDGTVQYTIAGSPRTGEYTFDASTKTVTIQTQMGQSVKAFVTVSGNAMALTFDASKLLTFVNTAAAKSQSLNNISSIASQFTGMKVGFQLTK